MDQGQITLGELKTKFGLTSGAARVFTYRQRDDLGWRLRHLRALVDLDGTDAEAWRLE